MKTTKASDGYLTTTTRTLYRILRVLRGNDADWQGSVYDGVCIEGRGGGDVSSDGGGEGNHAGATDGGDGLRLQVFYLDG